MTKTDQDGRGGGGDSSERLLGLLGELRGARSVPTKKGCPQAVILNHPGAHPDQGFNQAPEK